jgi:hypothetical protein
MMKVLIAAEEGAYGMLSAELLGAQIINRLGHRQKTAYPLPAEPRCKRSEAGKPMMLRNIYKCIVVFQHKAKKMNTM